MKNVVAHVVLLALSSVVASGCSGSSDTSSIPPAKSTAPGDPNGTEEPAPGATETPLPPGAQPAAFALAEGLAIHEIALFQGVKVSMVKDGNPVAKTNAPILAGRKGVLRVYVTPSASWDGREVVAELRIASEGKTPTLLTDRKSLRARSTDDVATSTFNFEIPAEALPADAAFSIALTDAKAAATKPTGESAALFPKDGTTTPMGLVPTGKLKLVIVPVRYDTDGSGRLPDVSASQLATYRNMMLRRYPASDVEVTLHEPFPWTSTISRDGTGFSSILNAIVKLRQTDRAAADVYYYGVFAPASSFGSFCQGGCVTGLSPVGQDPRDAFARASVGHGYPGSESASTMAHEVGHAHGRNHAPCGGANGVDASFPYSGGGIGVQGYDIVDRVFISASKGKDMMSYCPNLWVSDYTYTALHARIAFVNGAKSFSAPASPGGYRLVAVENGVTTSVESVTLDDAPQGEPRAFTWVGGSGAAIGDGIARFYKYDHLEGGIYVIPEGGPSAMATSVRVAGLSGALVVKK